ncbi:MAG: hypothetical protein K8T91_06905 [Planctomycetes bacterium]|nr:hypothetical protein [Planctomycetota bacterium]
MNWEPAQTDPQHARLTVLGIMAGVALFAVIVAIGAYLKTGKLLAVPVVLGTVGAFLLVWYLAWRRSIAEAEADASDED